MLGDKHSSDMNEKPYVGGTRHSMVNGAISDPMLGDKHSSSSEMNEKAALHPD